MLLEGETNFWDTPRLFSSLIMSCRSLGLHWDSKGHQKGVERSMEGPHRLGSSLYPIHFQSILQELEEIPGRCSSVSPHARKKRRQGGPAAPGRPSRRSCQSRPQPARRARGRPLHRPTATLRAPLSAQPVPRTLPRTSQRARSGDSRVGGGASTWRGGTTGE